MIIPPWDELDYSIRSWVRGFVAGVFAGVVTTIVVYVLFRWWLYY